MPMMRITLQRLEPASTDLFPKISSVIVRVSRQRRSLKILAPAERSISVLVIEDPFWRFMNQVIFIFRVGRAV
ncbi:hypothetical protein VKT23_006003 [Stygiomarasmius scandens]|uniref:Uncharacterized protein n=1 Tax=Marasmiellus scandens TaxID=2682957 RepID=A0ABR1JPW4_9AGAR